MKKYLFLLFGVLMLSARLPAQTGVTGNLTDHSTDCSTTNSCIAVPVLQNEGGVVFTLAGTFSGTVQFEASADGGTTWAALNATPSNSTTLATNATAPGTWQANIAAFTNVRLRCSVFSSGTINARINLSTASARAGGGGGGGGGSLTGSGANGQVTVWTGTSSLGAVANGPAGALLTTNGGNPATISWILPSFSQVYPGVGIAKSNGSAWVTSLGQQGTDTNLLSSGTISGTGATICTDANGGATTTGCAAPGGSVNAGTQYAFGEYATAGTAISSGPAPPTTNGQYTVGYSVTGGVAVAPTANQVGLSPRAITGTTATDTILYSDNANLVDYQGSVAVATSLPTPATLTNTHFYTILDNHTSGASTAITVTPAGGYTIGGQSTLKFYPGQECRLAVDPSSGSNWTAKCGVSYNETTRQVDAANAPGATAPEGLLNMRGNGLGDCDGFGDPCMEYIAVNDNTPFTRAIVNLSNTSARILDLYDSIGGYNYYFMDNTQDVNHAADWTFASNGYMNVGGTYGQFETDPTNSFVSMHKGRSNNSSITMQIKFDASNNILIQPVAGSTTQIGKFGGSVHASFDDNGNVTFGTDNATAGTAQMANSAANAHTIWGSAATTSNTILGFATVPTTNHLVSCVVSVTTCTLTDSGISSVSAGTVTSIATTSPITGGTITTTGTIACGTCVVASSPGAGIAHFAGSTQTVTSSAVVGADMTNNTVTATQLAAQYSKIRCNGGLGDGLNAIVAGTYLQFTCVNTSGVTWTITGINCWTDNAGTSTLNAANNAATGLLTGAVTCNATKSGGGAAGTQSATTTLANNDAISFTFVADGTSKQTNWTVSMTQ